MNPHGKTRSSRCTGRQAELADQHIAGTIDEIEEVYQNPSSIWKWEVEPPEQLYTRIKEMWKAGEPPSSPGTNSTYYTADPAFSQVLRKDPCPCGSGKKYKKCCLSK